VAVPVPPGATLPTVHVTLFPTAATEPAVAVEETYVMPVGSGSVTTTPVTVAFDGLSYCSV
jgi:hypothetical protein